MNPPIDPQGELAALLGACARQDTRAFSRLYEMTAPTLLGCLIRILRRRALAEEVLQDVFVHIWQRANQYDGERGRAWPWLVSVARYRAIDILRRERADATDPFALADALEDEAGAGVSTGESLPGDAQDLARCLDTLGAEQRNSIRLAFLNGRSHPEIAQALDRPLGSVKSWIRRGLVSLRECIEACNVRAQN
jgi:RNA polymerase sigma-70 factor, ECF subfamily